MSNASAVKAKEEAITSEASGEAKVEDAPSLRSGFVYGLAGAAVRHEGAVTGGAFNVNDGKKAIARWDDVEAPYPTNDAAAKEAAEIDGGCSTRIYCLKDGKIVTHKLTGLAAAVTIALQQRRDEGFRGKVRSGSIKGEDQLRKAILSTYGFTIGKVEARVSKDDLAAILADDDATPEEKLAAMQEMLAAGGVNVK